MAADDVVSVDLSSHQVGTYRYTSHASFEKGDATHWLALVDGGSRVEGVRFE